MKKFKNILYKTNLGFSLIEIVVALVVIAIIIAVLMPVITKRLTSTSTVKNRISTSCDSLYTDGYCAMCYLNPKSCIICTRECQEYEYKNTSDCKCEDCKVKYNNNNCTRCNSQHCTQCSPGYYLKDYICTKCEAGYRCYIDGSGNSIKEICPKGTAAAGGASVCTACKASSATQQGSIAVIEGSSSCSICSNGKYASQDKQSTPCEKCPKGYYCPSGKKSPCPKGTAGISEGLSNLNQCTNCAASSSTTTGTYNPSEGQSSCISCGDGQYTANAAQSACAPCQAGKYCPSGKIIDCPKGYYQNRSGQSTCLGCVKSTSTQQGNVAINTGQTSCSVCASGYYAEINMQGYACKVCPSGYACSGGKVNQCSAGYYSNKAQGATACAACPSGTTSNIGASSCVSCTSGCSTCSTTSTNCNSCKSGYYKSGSSCKKCSAGYYSNGGTAGSCTACTSGTYSTSGASSCLSCSSKYGEFCKACDANECKECKEGYTLTDDKKGCKKANCPDNSVKIKIGADKELCVTQYNVGDGGIPLSGVNVAYNDPNGSSNSKANYCWSSATYPCCWTGYTTSQKYCGLVGSYSGCTRTLCNHYAAKIACSNLTLGGLNWRLPTTDELLYFYDSSNSLWLCDNLLGNAIAGATCVSTSGKRTCPGSNVSSSVNGTSSCYPAKIWSSSANTSTSYKVYELGKKWASGSHDATHALSARCVSEL